MNTTKVGDSRTQELERRISELEAHDEATLGHFTRWDWAICIGAFVALPLVAAWWFAG